MSMGNFERKKIKGAFVVIKEIALNSSVGWSFVWPAILANALRSIIDATVFILIAITVYSNSGFTWSGISFPEYVLAGLFAGLMLSSSLTIPTGSLNFAYGMGELDVYLSLPYGVYPHVIGSLFYSYLVDIIYMITYLTIGCCLLGCWPNPLNVLYAFLIIVLGSLAVLGIGLLSSISYLRIHVKNPEPLTWIINLLVNLLTGYYFPISLLPRQLRFLTNLFPHTYVFKLVRFTLYGKGIPIGDLVTLAIMTVIILPIGILTYVKVIEHCEKKGVFLKWS
ncbi:MAG TPA: hypothetical protein ENF87_01380 [Thermoproteales archaeon]|nr:hypothetical protein [Thermoproteales archaeon]